MKNLTQSPDKIEFLYFGELYNCKKCGKARGIANGKDLSQEEYKKMSEKYEKIWKCAETGKKLLSVCMKENIICPECKRLVEK